MTEDTRTPWRVGDYRNGANWTTGLAAPDFDAYAIFDDGRYIVRADYAGGAYVEITFGGYAPRPTEVGNVWDYETGKPEIGEAPGDVRRWLWGWMVSQDAEWPTWYTDYLDNAAH